MNITVDQVSGWMVRVTVAVDPGMTGTMSITRIGSQGSRPVQGAQRVPVLSGTWDDAEVELGVPTRYQLTLSNGSVLYTAPVTVVVDGGFPVLSDPYRGQSVLVTVLETERAVKHAARATLVDVEGRADPVVIWDVEQAGRTPEVKLMTRTASDAYAVETMCATGNPLLLRAPCPSVVGGWLQRVGDRVHRPFAPSSRTEVRVHELADVLELPGTWRPGARPTGDTLADLDAAVGHTTLAAIAARWDMLLAIASTDLKALA